MRDNSPNTPFSLLIKPASGDCNLDCSYCFYPGQAGLYRGNNRRRMNGQVLEQIISSYMRTEQPQYIFTWQGGEPTLMGLDFYRRAVGLQEKYGRDGSVVANGIQTNGTLIDDEFAGFFREYAFLVGVSLDGPPDLHNGYRTYKNGTGSYKEVMKGIEHLKANQVEFNILTLVNRANVKKGKEVYRFLCDSGFFYHQYIECADCDENGHPLPYSISAEEWGDFLCEIYDEWMYRDIHRVSIRLFDSILACLLDNQHNICRMGHTCNRYFVVEYNGDIYPCDFFVDDDLKIGNIGHGTWAHFQKSTIYTFFASQKNKWNSQCDSCEYLPFCSGDCLKNRFSIKNDPQQLSRLCKGWKTFFKHALPGFRQIAAEL